MVTVALLFPATGSVELVVTLAVFERVLALAGEVTTIVMVVDAPFANVPSVQTTLAVWLHAGEGVAETKIVPVGIVSETETLLALARP